MGTGAAGAPGAGGAGTEDAACSGSNPPGYDSESGREMARVQATFPQFRIWQETTYGRSRYIARSTQPGVNPHTLITSDLSELRTELSTGGPA